MRFETDPNQRLLFQKLLQFQNTIFSSVWCWDVLGSVSVSFVFVLTLSHLHNCILFIYGLLLLTRVFTVAF